MKRSDVPPELSEKAVLYVNEAMDKFQIEKVSYKNQPQFAVELWL